MLYLINFHHDLNVSLCIFQASCISFHFTLSDDVLVPPRMDIRRSSVFCDVGVIGRSAYWLVYWLPRHSRLEKAELTTHLPDAVGGAVVEVGVV